MLNLTHVTQELHEEDLASRVAMSETLINRIDSDSYFLKNLIFSDESKFYLNSVVNRHNYRIWGIEPPKETIQIPHFSPKMDGVILLQDVWTFFHRREHKW